MKKTFWEYYAYPIFWFSITCALVYALQSILFPLITSFFLAYLLYPLILKLRKMGVPRSIAVGLIFSISFVLLFSAIILLIPRLVNLGLVLAKDSPKFIIGALNSLDFLGSQYDIPFLKITSHDLIEEFSRYIDTFSITTLTSLSGVFQNTIFNLVSMVKWVLKLFVFPIFFFFALDKYEKIEHEFFTFIPQRYRHYVREFAAIFDLVLSGYIRGQLVVCTILAVFFSAAFWYVGLPFGLIIGVLTGFSFMVPYVGFASAFIFGTAMALSSFVSVAHFLTIIGIFLLGQAVESFVLTPRITGNRVGLDPFVTILSLMIGANMMGFVGILIAIPLAAIIKQYYLRLKSQYYLSDFYIKSTPGL